MKYLYNLSQYLIYFVVFIIILTTLLVAFQISLNKYLKREKLFFVSLLLNFVGFLFSITAIYFLVDHSNFLLFEILFSFLILPLIFEILIVILKKNFIFLWEIVGLLLMLQIYWQNSIGLILFFVGISLNFGFELFYSIKSYE